MLHKIEIENFYSVGERQVIDLCARKSVKDDWGRLSPIYKGAEERAPNVVALFGPNASGKSNVLRAIVFGMRFLTSSFGRPVDEMMPYEKFGDVEKMADKPSRLAISFSGPADFQNASGKGPQCPYTYELILSPRGKEIIDHVLLEKMSYRPRGRGKPTTIFERKADNITKCAQGFLTTQEKGMLKRMLRPNASAVSTLMQFDHEIAKSWAHNNSAHTNIFIDKIEVDDAQLTQWYKNNPEALDQLKRMVRRIDLGIEKVVIDIPLYSRGRPQSIGLGIEETTGDVESKPELQFRHSGLDQYVSFERESHGTRQLIKALPHILGAFDSGGLSVIDDLDTAIHPLILPEILRWFGSREYNPRNAQLWMTCHSVSLLHELTKEEVLFCEKNRQGCTEVYGLADIEGVRRDEDFDSKYLSGVYGAVPSIG